MYEKLSPEGKLRFAEMKIASAQKAFAYWEKLESEYKQKYGPDPKWYECKHIHKIKQYKKQAFADCEYWENLRKLYLWQCPLPDSLKEK